MTRTLFALCAFMLATAQPAAAQDAPRVEINAAGIDAASPGGADLLRRQINQAARTVCAGVEDVDGWHLRKSACIQTARAQGNRQLAHLREQALAAREDHGRARPLALPTE
jgi:UrcA family protein